MKIAYLISAHNDPQHLQRLVGSLQPRSEFFIHIDASVDIRPFRKVLPDKNIHFCSKRMWVEWGNISQVRYQIALMEEYFRTGIPCDRLCFLSGLDYPLWSNSRMDRFWEETGDREFIQGIDMTVQRDELQEWYRLYRPFTTVPLRNRRWKIRLCALGREMCRLAGMRKTLVFTVDGKIYRLHKGSSWWCITPKLAEWMLHEVHAHPGLLRYFTTLFGPDETLWQTLVFNSPFADKALLQQGAYTTLADLTPLHYIHYHPVIKVFTAEDWGTLRLSGKMFCRKTVSGTSDTLLDLIDRARAEERPK
ncbi:MAG: beta-1,6-N-acetylglucosaminyltransferase [Clostridium sp.]|nr:beta-1,6-N-acetylglucosaminyltransferase [Clostridium sp.]